jgi:hypothetical protein
MTKTDKVHLFVIATLNLFLVAKMISTAWEGNDKAIILIIFGQPFLIFVNAAVCLVLRTLKRKEYKIYKFITIGLIALFLPALGAASMY